MSEVRKKYRAKKVHVHQGLLLKRVRNSVGFSQTELSEVFLGYKSQNFSNCERGLAGIHLKVWKVIFVKFGGFTWSELAEAIAQDSRTKVMNYKDEAILNKEHEQLIKVFNSDLKKVEQPTTQPIIRAGTYA